MVMSQQGRAVEAGASDKSPRRKLTAAAERALAEAEARSRLSLAPALPPERDGRGGLDPVRYGDWEVKGLASDF